MHWKLELGLKTISTVLTAMLPETSKQRQTISCSQEVELLVDSVVAAGPGVVVDVDSGNSLSKPETWTILNIGSLTGLDPLVML